MHTKRNRDILEAFEAGATVEQLAAAHNVTCNRVRAILNDERHKQAISPEPFYRTLRKAEMK